VKLRHLEKWNSRRIDIAEKYYAGIQNEQIILPKRMDEVKHVYHIFGIRCAHRNALETYLAEKGIMTNKHYPIPMHLQKAYEDLQIPKGALPIAEEISDTELSIPMYYGMTDEEVQYVIDVLNQFE